MRVPGVDKTAAGQEAVLGVDHVGVHVEAGGLSHRDAHVLEHLSAKTGGLDRDLMDPRLQERDLKLARGCADSRTGGSLGEVPDRDGCSGDGRPLGVHDPTFDRGGRNVRLGKDRCFGGAAQRRSQRRPKDDGLHDFLLLEGESYNVGDCSASKDRSGAREIQGSAVIA